MIRSKALTLSLAMAPVLAVFLAAPVASRAAETGNKVKCEVTKDGKKTTEMVKSAEECTQMGGKVATAHKKKKTTS
ncbi:MAG TPA: hypothetical protein VMW35_16140 [Myxococcota bacterium]|nr:hypothetical protein [Myxococcota bacterium]